jgi:hypothetical protein
MQESLGKLPSVEELRARQQENAAAAHRLGGSNSNHAATGATPVKKVFSRIKSFFT